MTIKRIKKASYCWVEKLVRRLVLRPNLQFKIMKNPLYDELLIYQPTGTEVEDFYPWYIVSCVLNVLLTITAIVLNSVTIQALRKASSLSKPLRTLLLSLAFTDLGVGLLCHPFNIAFLIKWLRQNMENYPTCAAYTAFTLITNSLSKASFSGIAALSVDRFLAIHLHLRYQELVTHRRVGGVVVVMWILSVLFALFRFLVSTDITYVVFAINGIICYVVSACLYFRIYLAVRRHKHQIQAQNGEIAANVASASKSAVGTFYVYLVFLFCYLPNSFSLAFIALQGSNAQTKVSTIYTWTLVLLNSSLNPVIYCWKLRPIRRAVMDILRNILSQLRKASE